MRRGGAKLQLVIRNFMAMAAGSLVIFGASLASAAVLLAGVPGEDPTAFPPPLSFSPGQADITTVNIYFDTQGEDIWAIDVSFLVENVSGDWDVFLELPRGGEWEAECESTFDGSSGGFSCFSEDAPATDGPFNIAFFEIIRTNETPGDSLDLNFDQGMFLTEAPLSRGPGGTFANPPGSTIATFVPEPSTFAMLALGVLGAARTGRREA